MNTQTTTLFAPISKQQLENLTTQVKETLASENAKTFSAVDMWNILRQRKSFVRTRGI